MPLITSGKAARGLGFILGLTVLVAAAHGQPAARALSHTPYVLDCGPRSLATELCRQAIGFTPQDAARRLGAANLAYWIDGHTLNVVARSNEPEVVLAGTIQEDMTPLPFGPGLWGASYRVPELDKSIIEMGMDDNRSVAPTLLYRGGQAPPAPPSNAALKGRVQTLDIKSVALGGSRQVSVYIPPGRAPKGGWPVVIAANGEAMGPYLSMIDALIERREIQPVAVVAIWSDGKAAQAGEYLHGKDADAYQRHALFVAREVMPMMEKSFSITADPARRLLFGYGDGADWTLETAARDPAMAGSIAAFSPPALTEPPWRPAKGAHQRIYVAAGAYEPPFVKGGRQTCNLAGASGDICTLQIAYAGHTPAFWQSELARVLKLVFPARG
jgi:enterochelin esterase-like enzyme